MRYHVYSLVVKPVNGEVSYLLDDLLDKKLIEGQEREPSVDHCSGNVTVYLMVRNKDKFLRHLNKRWKESADPTRFIMGKLTYLGLKSKSEKSNGKMKDVKNFIKETKYKKR